MPRRFDLRAELAVGRHALDRGRVLEITQLLVRQPRRAERLIEFLWDDDPGVASRAADVLERVSAHRSPALMRILNDIRRHCWACCPTRASSSCAGTWRLSAPASPHFAEARRAAATLYTFLDDRSSIVKTAALQVLADLTRHDPDRSRRFWICSDPRPLRYSGHARPLPPSDQASRSRRPPFPASRSGNAGPAPG